MYECMDVYMYACMYDMYACMNVCMCTCTCMCMYMRIILCNSCNMGMKDLPDMYAQSPRTAGPRVEDIIKQMTSANITTVIQRFIKSQLVDDTSNHHTY